MVQLWLALKRVRYPDASRQGGALDARGGSAPMMWKPQCSAARPAHMAAGGPPCAHLLCRPQSK